MRLKCYCYLARALEKRLYKHYEVVEKTLNEDRRLWFVKTLDGISNVRMFLNVLSEEKF